MAAPNYAAYDGRKKLSHSAAGHLWVEMEPVARRDGQTHPGPADSGWKYVFWVWLKDSIHEMEPLENYPKGFQQFPRSLYLEIARSEEFAALVEAIPELRPRPLFLFPNEDRSAPPRADVPAKPRPAGGEQKRKRGRRPGPWATYLPRTMKWLNEHQPGLLDGPQKDLEDAVRKILAGREARDIPKSRQALMAQVKKYPPDAS